MARLDFKGLPNGGHLHLRDARANSVENFFEEEGTKVSTSEVKITGTLCQAAMLRVAMSNSTTGDGRCARPNPICGEVVNRSLMQ